jgi:GTP-binding protein
MTVKVLSQFLTAATDPRQFPPCGPPEIAFLGRSNVGKSSVINSLLGSKVAKTSSTPGRTRTINFFAVRWPGKPRPELIFADLPGYGYAKVPQEISAEWPRFIEPYLKQRPTLALSIVLVDANVPPQPSDIQLCDWLRSCSRRFALVATKVDRLSANRVSQTLAALEEALGPESVTTYSAKSGQGRDELWKYIRTAAEALQASGSSSAPVAG